MKQPYFLCRLNLQLKQYIDKKTTEYPAADFFNPKAEALRANRFFVNFERLCFDDYNFLYFITTANCINYFEPFHYFTKAGMVPIEMTCIFATMANKEL